MKRFDMAVVPSGSGFALLGPKSDKKQSTAVYRFNE